MNSLFGSGKQKQTQTQTATPSKQKPFEQDLLGAGGAMWQQILSELGYEVVPEPQRDFAGELIGLEQQKRKAVGENDSAAEEEIQAQIDALKTEQTAYSRRANRYGASPMTIRKRALTPEEQQQAAFENTMRQQYQGMLKGDYSIDPATEKALNEYYGTAMEQSQREINKAATFAAASRGLGLSDTPIGQPFLRATAENAQNISGQKARSFLDVRSADLAHAGGYMSYFDTLKQLKGFQNPMNLAQGISNFGTSLYASRFNKGTTTSTGTTSGGGGFNLGGLLSLGSAIAAPFTGGTSLLGSAAAAGSPAWNIPAMTGSFHL